MTSPDFSEKSILVVDDSPLMLRVVRAALTSAKYVGEAKSATDAVKLFVKQPFDLLVLDICMPGTGGLELAEWIRKERNSQVPIVFLTSFSEAEIVRRAAAVGNMDYLLKPLKPKLLQEKIARLLEAAAQSETEQEPEASG